MDFEKIDSVLADTLDKGDIVSVTQADGVVEYLQITGPVDDDGTGILVYPAHNLSTGDDEDAYINDENAYSDIYRSY